MAGWLYIKLKEHSDKDNISMSSFVEKLILKELNIVPPRNAKRNFIRKLSIVDQSKPSPILPQTAAEVRRVLDAQIRKRQLEKAQADATLRKFQSDVRAAQNPCRKDRCPVLGIHEAH